MKSFHTQKNSISSRLTFEIIFIWKKNVLDREQISRVLNNILHSAFYFLFYQRHLAQNLRKCSNSFRIANETKSTESNKFSSHVTLRYLPTWHQTASRFNWERYLKEMALVVPFSISARRTQEGLEVSSLRLLLSERRLGKFNL